jgi:threonine dehydratase
MLAEDEMRTEAEGLATRTGFELPQRIIRERLHDFVLVTEEELRTAMLHMLERTRNLIEAAGAAPLAAALRLGERLHGQRVGLIASGGNVSLEQLRALLSAG